MMQKKLTPFKCSKISPANSSISYNQKETSCVALFTRWGYKRVKVNSRLLVASSREHFDYTITAAADDPSAVAAPVGRTDAFAAH